MAADASLESELAALLERLAAAQRELLALLATKREVIIRRDHSALAALAVREQALGDELRSCHGDMVVHSAAQYELFTGRTVPGFPSMGSWVIYGLGSESRTLPAYVVMPDPADPRRLIPIQASRAGEPLFHLPAWRRLPSPTSELVSQ